MFAIVVNVLCFFVGALAIVVLIGNVFLPLLYFLPRLTSWIIRRWITPLALARFLLLLVVWITLFTAVPAALAHWFPTATFYIAHAIGWKFGQSVGFIFSLIRLFSASGRRDVQSDFLRLTFPFLTPAGSVAANRLL